MPTSPADFYTAQSQRFGPSGILDHHRERASRLDQALNQRRTGRVLELGAGAGGTAAATAELGYEVTAIELSPLRAEYARDLASTVNGSLTIVEGDFYTADLGHGYDAVAYWNGFGMNEDADQRRLLRRVADEWLAPGGFMLVDIFNPSWWAQRSTEPRMHEEYQACQQTTFDSRNSRFVDRWWPVDSEQNAIEQSIRCYSPVDLELLLEGTGMSLAGIDTAESMPLGDSYSYRVVLRPATTLRD
jgi:SAM-dependent methyltransferase